MVDTYPPTVQRLALLKLVGALGVRDNTLRRDECGDWRISGRVGHIYAVPGSLARRGVEGFQIYFRGAREFEEPLDSKAWTWAKKALPFCDVTNDGDEEGMLFLDHLPIAEEAAVVRDKLGIAKKREMGEEEMARRQEWASGNRHKSAQGVEVDGSVDQRPVSDKHRIL